MCVLLYNWHENTLHIKETVVFMLKKCQNRIELFLLLQDISTVDFTVKWRVWFHILPYELKLSNKCKNWSRLLYLWCFRGAKTFLEFTVFYSISDIFVFTVRAPLKMHCVTFYSNLLTQNYNSKYKSVVLKCKQQS